MGIDRKEKKDLRASLAGFVKASKSNETRRTSCLLYVSKHWGVQHWNRFVRLYYSQYSKIFFYKVIIVVKLMATMLKRTIAIQKLNNIVISRF